MYDDVLMLLYHLLCVHIGTRRIETAMSASNVVTIHWDGPDNVPTPSAENVNNEQTVSAASAGSAQVASPTDAHTIVEAGSQASGDAAVTIQKNKNADDLGFTISSVPRLDITICYKDISHVVKVPVEEAGIKTVLSPVIDTVKYIATLGGSAKTKDFYRVHECTGVIRPGTMTMILGPPGHGKSSFLKAIAARLPITSGKVTFNGRTEEEALAEGCHTTKLTQFVDQTDSHLPLLTVRETLEFAHRVSSAHYNPERIDQTLKLLGLEECADTIIGDALIRGISGGQKRRVTLGEMLMGDAAALFLDEYSNGLDTATSEDITRALRAWVRANNSCVVANLQQPTPGLFECYDDIILIRDSTVVYHGPTQDVLPYLETMGFQCPDDVDVCDFLMDVLSQPRVAVDRQNAHISMLEKKVAQKKATRAVLETAETKLDHDGKHKHKKRHYEKDEEEELNNLIRGPVARKLSSGIVVDAAPAPRVTTADMVAHWKGTQLYKDMLKTVDYHMDPANRSSLPQLLPSEEAKVCYALDYSLPTSELFPLIMKRQWLLLSRNRSMVMPRLMQCIIMGLLQGSLYYQVGTESFFLRVATLLICLNQVAFGNMVELPIAVLTNRIVFKHYAARFYPPWLQVLSFNIIGIPLGVAEILLLTSLVYWMSGCVADAGVYFIFLAICFCQSFMLGTWFRFLSATAKTEAQAQAIAGPSTGVFMLFGGFFITLSNMPVFMRWIFWLSPFSWSVRALANNEFLTDRYSASVTSNGKTVTLGQAYLEQLDMKEGKEWIGYGAIYMLGLAVFLMSMHSWLLFDRYRETSIGTKRFDDEPEGVDGEEEDEAPEAEMPRAVPITSYGEAAGAIEMQPIPSGTNAANTTTPTASAASNKRTRSASGASQSSYGSRQGGLSVLREAIPFTPVWLSFSNIKYTVDVEVDGKPAKRVLLDNINGYAEPGKLTALMGASGAGKTTLLDVLANRKNMGKIEGKILFNGVEPTKEEYARFTGYVEQFDSLLPYDTVRETLLFAARLRLPSTVDDSTKEKIVDEVIEILDLAPIANMIIGSPTYPSLSPSQLKRVNIGCELVANPSVLYLDEPTTGLDSRSAQTVMRVVRRIARVAGRSVICTIHQPSAELFYYFDRLVLLAAGGHQIYFGDLGSRARTFIRYLSAVPRVRPIKPNYNPATWMLEEVGVGVAALKETEVDGVRETPAELVQRLKAYYLKSPVWEKMKKKIETLEAFEDEVKTRAREGALDVVAAGEKAAEDQVARSQMSRAESHMSHISDDNEREYSVSYNVGGSGPGLTRTYSYSEASGISTVSAAMPDSPTLVSHWVAPSFWTQLGLVVARAFRSYYRNPPFLFGRIRIVTFLSILFGLIYLNLEIKTQSSVVSKIAVVQVTAGFGSLVHAASATPVMMENRPVFYRERSSGMYQPWMWTAAQFIAELWYCLFSSMLLTIPCYFMVGLVNEAAAFFKHWFATYFLCILYVTMSVLVSSIAKTTPIATVIQGMYFGFFFTFSGVAITTPKIPKGYMWLYRGLPMSHLTEALVIPQFRTCEPFPQCGALIDVVENDATVQRYANAWLLEYLGFGPDGYWTELGWATIYLLCAMILAFIASTKLVFQSR